MWVWDQSSGKLEHGGVLISIGYSGYGEGKNNPLMQEIIAIGPIPKGLWFLMGVYDSKKVGHFAIVLEPDKLTKVFGRSAFRIHGDSVKQPGKASNGCIILPRIIREKMWKSSDHSLTVV